MGAKSNKSKLVHDFCTCCGNDLPQYQKLRIRIPKIKIYVAWPGKAITEWEDFCAACSMDYLEDLQNRKLESNEKYAAVMAAANRWSRDYDCCRNCTRTDRPHNARGYCTACYMWAQRKGLIPTKEKVDE